MWTARPIIYDDEDEAELIQRFVDMSAKWEGRYTAYEIAHVVFENQRDPGRAFQAAEAWGNDLSIKERINEAIVSGVSSAPFRVPKVVDLAWFNATSMAIMFDTKLVPQEKLARHKLLESIAEANGIIKKDKGNNNSSATVNLDAATLAELGSTLAKKQIVTDAAPEV